MTITVDAIEIPDDLHWVDEHDWTPIAQTEQFTLTGSLVVDQGAKSAGRPITLTSGEAPKGAAIDGALLTLLKSKVSSGVAMVLYYRGVSFDVMWRGNNPITATSLVPELADPDADSLFWITLRFIEVPSP